MSLATGGGMRILPIAFAFVPVDTNGKDIPLSPVACD